MERNRDYCFRHSKMYEGYQCPQCAEEEDEQKAGGAPAEGRGKAKAAAPGPSAAGEYQPPSRIESKAKSDQAEAMLLSGAAREALDLCESAVERDPRNLHAHLVGARASRILRDGAREREFLDDTIKLLRTEEYGGTSHWYHEVLKHARDSTLVSQVTKTFVSARAWPAADALPMVRTLVGRGAVAEALVVLDSLPPSDRSLLTCAYSMQLTGGSFARVDPDLQAYLDQTPAGRRDRILAEMLDLQASDVIGGSTLSTVRDAVRRRYEGWAPEIKQLLSEEARAASAEKVAPRLNGPATAAAVRFFLGAIVIAVVLVVALGGGAPGFGLGLVVALGCAGAGFAYGRDVELKKLLPTVLPAVREELTEREVERWGSILTDDSGGGADDHLAARAGETCPYCGTSVTAGAPTCPQCSRSLALETPEVPPGGAEAPPGDGTAEAAALPSEEPGPAGDARSSAAPGGSPGVN